MILPLKIKHLNTCFLKYSAWSISSTVSFYSALGIMILLLFAPKGASSQTIRMDTIFFDFVLDSLYFNPSPTSIDTIGEQWTPLTFPYGKMNNNLSFMNGRHIIIILPVDSVGTSFSFESATDLTVYQVIADTLLEPPLIDGNGFQSTEIIADSVGRWI